MKIPGFFTPYAISVGTRVPTDIEETVYAGSRDMTISGNPETICPVKNPVWFEPDRRLIGTENGYIRENYI
jgi:hypothetical protein